MKSSVSSTEEGALFIESSIKNIGLTRGHGTLRVFVKSWIEEDAVLINIPKFQLCVEIII